MDRFFTICGALLAFLGVALGAFGAHGLKRHFEVHPDLLPIYKTATEYHMYHALALLALAWAVTRWPGALMQWSGFLFIGGVVVFSGSLYVLVFTNVRAWGAVTPIGGVAFLAGWALLLIGAARAAVTR